MRLFSRFAARRGGARLVTVIPPTQGEVGEWAPDLPADVFTTAVPVVTGTTYNVAAGDSAAFAQALTDAQYGDEIVIAAGGATPIMPVNTTTGFVFPVKAGYEQGKFVLIRSANTGSLPSLPANGRSPASMTALNNPRVGAAHKANLAY